jgi:hypothetical protein
MTDERRPLPADPMECRQNAEELLAHNDGGDDPVAACAWALLAIAAELATIRRSVKR